VTNADRAPGTVLLDDGPVSPGRLPSAEAVAR
jgi:hypothetical protein